MYTSACIVYVEFDVAMIRRCFREITSITYQELLTRYYSCSRRVTSESTLESFRPDEFPITRYTTQLHEAEKENFGQRYGNTLAADDTQVGDYYIYEIVGRSYIVKEKQ